MNTINQPRDYQPSKFVISYLCLLGRLWGEHDLEFVVEDQDEGTTGTSDNVRKSTLEEGFSTFILGNLDEAVKGSGVKNLLLTRLHHESSSDGVQRIRSETSQSGDELGNHELENDAAVRANDGSLKGIVTTEVGTSVGDNTEDRDSETSVETSCAIGLGDLGDTVNETGELSSFLFTDISGQSCSCEVQRIDENEGSGTGSTTGGKVSEEEPPEISLWVEWVQVFLVGVLEGEVKGLGWEISDDIGQVSSPEGGETFFLWNSDEDISDTLVLPASELVVGVLGLKKQFNSFNWSDGSLGDGGRDTSEHEIQSEVTGFDR